MPYDLTGRALRPLGRLLSLDEFTLGELLPPEEAATLFGGLYYTEAEVYVEGGDIVLNVWLAFEDELALRVPGIDAVEVVLGAAGAGWTAVQARIAAGPGAAAALLDVPMVVRVDGALLQPMLSATEPDPDATATEIDLGTVSFSADTDGFHLQAGIEAALPLCMVAGTGVVLEAGTVRWLTPDLLEAPVEGTPPGFTGLHVEGARVHLPDVDFLPDTVVLEHCFIGTGGLTGSVAAAGGITWDQGALAYSGDMAGTLLGFPCGLTGVSLEFVQSSLVAGAVNGELYLPFFNKRVGIDLELGMGGEFTLALSGPRATNPDPDVELRNGLLHLHVAGILDLDLDNAAISKAGEVVTVLLSGRLTPLPAGLDWPTVMVEELAIGSDGSIRLAGGWLDLGDQYALDFHGFQIEITRIGFGASDDGGRWLGLSGGVRLVDALAAGASVDGLQVTWYDDGRPIRISLDGVGVEFAVPDVLHFKGTVSYRELEVGGATVHRFDGTIALELDALGMAIDGALVIGTAEGADSAYGFMALYLDAQLPAGIPLWATGLALYGLFALNMEPGKLPPEPWYGTGPDDGWYRRSPTGVTDLAGKWVNRSGSLALGGGITIGTLPDNGFTFNGRVLLVITLPGPVILLEGRANLLAERTGLAGGEEPAFEALAVLDGRAGTFLVGVDAGYRYGGGGELIDIHAGAEAFFSLTDAAAWHLYLGQKTPKERRVRAAALELFQADAYLMLDQRQLAAGVSIGYDERWRFGPVSLSLGAWIDGDAVVSWKPTHLTGELWLHGGARVAVAGFGIGLSVDARFQADVYEPYHLLASFHVAVKLPWPVPDFETTITLEWGPQPDPPPLPLPLEEIAVAQTRTTATWPLPRRGTPALVLPDWDPDGDGFLTELPAATVAAQQAAPPPGDLPVVPMDGRPRLTFGRAVHDDALIGVNPQPVVPAYERLGDPALDQGPTRARYALTEVALHRWDGAAWVLAARKGLTANPAGVDELFGSWAAVPAIPDGTGTSTGQTKLWLWALTPFAWSSQTTQAWSDWFTTRFTGYPCVPPAPESERCLDFEAVDRDQELTAPWDWPGGGGLRLSWEPDRPQPVVGLHTPLAGRDHALCFGADSAVTIALPVPALRVTVWLGSISATGATPDVLAVGATVAGATVGPVVSSAGQVTIAADPSGPNGQVDRLVSVELRCGQPFCLVAVCVTLPPPAQERAWREQLSKHFEDELARWSQTGAVLAADTTYRLTVVTKVETTDDPIGDGEVEITELAYFRTGAPPGLGELAVPLGVADPEGFSSGLEDLTRYVRQTMPASVPAPGQPPPLPRPVYRAYDVGVEFAEDYVELLYRLGGQALRLFLFDVDGRPLRGVDGAPLALANRWGQAETVTLTEDERRWISVINASDCVETGIDTTAIATDQTLTAALPPAVTLQPDTLYEARLLALPPLTAAPTDSELAAAPVVYRWSFMTSRFATFADHAGSFQGITWLVELDDVAGLAAAAAAAGPIGSAQAWPGEEEARAFDAVAALALDPRAFKDAAQVEVVRVDADGDALAFLVRSPEPIAWDRTALELQRGRHPRRRGTRPVPVPVPSATVLRERDGTGLVISIPAATAAGTRLDPGEYHLQLTYRRDNQAQDPTSQVLSQAGNSDPEVATLGIPWQTLPWPLP